MKLQNGHFTVAFILINGIGNFVIFKVFKFRVLNVKIPPFKPTFCQHFDLLHYDKLFIVILNKMTIFSRQISVPHPLMEGLHLPIEGHILVTPRRSMPPNAPSGHPYPG